MLCYLCLQALPRNSRIYKEIHGEAVDDDICQAFLSASGDVSAAHPTPLLPLSLDSQGTGMDLRLLLALLHYSSSRCLLHLLLQ